MKNSLWWIAWRLLTSKKTLFGGSTSLSLVGLVLGVAALVVSMAVMSGFEATLKRTMTDVSAHVQVVKRSRFPDNWKELVERIRTAEPRMLAATRFVFVEAVMAQKGELSGVLLQGLDAESMNDVLNLSGRLLDGDLKISVVDGQPSALIGKNLAAKMNLKAGDTFRLVVPVADSVDPGKFQRRMGVFRVQGILDLGKYEWNERFVMADLKATQDLAAIGDRYSGLLLKFDDVDYARKAALNLSGILGSPYWVRDWYDSNQNLFEAVVVERPGIFMVVLVITLVAAFNVSAALLVNVVRRYKDIAVLKTMGVSSRSIMKIFAFQGLFLGGVGLILGYILGIILCFAFSLVQSRLGLISGEVYRLDGIELNIRWVDTLAICSATLLICFLATLAPARRGSRLNPAEGLRNE